MNSKSLLMCIPICRAEVYVHIQYGKPLVFPYYGAGPRHRETMLYVPQVLAAHARYGKKQ